jgi:hypothetical protein
VFIREGSSESTHVAIAVLSDGSTISAEVIENVQTLGVEPFSTITYWWQIDFANGDNYITDPASFVYEDNRFDWRSMGNSNITVHWIEGDITRGQDILNLANDSILKIQHDLALPPTGVEGQISLERDLPHELVHILLYERMGDQYHNLPTWLNEGLATLQEGVPNPAYIFELDRAARENALISMHSLCASFPISEEDALLAYAQSASFTQYMLDIYGVGGIALLLDAYQEGTSCEGGVQRVYQRPSHSIRYHFSP